MPNTLFPRKLVKAAVVVIALDLLYSIVKNA